METNAIPEILSSPVSWFPFNINILLLLSKLLSDYYQYYSILFQVLNECK